MEGDFDDPGSDNARGPSESLNFDDIRNGDGNVAVEAITSRDIDALVQLKLLRKAL
jgi:hypothetical protein